MVAASATYGAAALQATGENVKEDVSQIISNISPTETPFFSSCSKADSTADQFDWLVDVLQAPGANAHVDGDDFGTTVTNDETNAPSRYFNYLQILKKQAKITRRAEKMSKHGRKSERSYQIAKKLKEIKRDAEYQLLISNAAVAESGTTPAEFASVPTWIITNDYFGTGGASATLSSTTHGAPTTDRTAGTARALSESSHLLPAIQAAYTAGGDASVIMVDPALKQRLSSYLFAGPASGVGPRVATAYQDHMSKPRRGGTVLGAVDYYVSDFGVFEIIPNRQMTSTLHLFILDMELWKIRLFDGVMVEPLAKIGDSARWHIIMDMTLEACNEAGNALVTDLQDAAVLT